MRAVPQLLATTALAATVALPALAQGVSEDRARQTLQWVLRDWDVVVDSVDVGEITGDIAYSGIRATRGEDVFSIGRLEIAGAVYDGQWMIGFDGIALDGLRVRAKDDAAVAIDRIALDSAGLDWSRPLEQFREAGELEDPQLLIDFITDAEVASLLVEGMSVVDDDANIQIGRLSYSGLADGVLTAFSMEGLDIVDDEATVAIERLEATNFRVGALLRTVLAEPLALLNNQEIADVLSARDLIETVTIIDTFVLRGLSVAVADLADPITVDSIGAAFSGRVGGMPTTANGSIDGLVIPISVIDDPMVLNTLGELGLSELEIGVGANSTYDPDTMILTGEQTVSVRDIGSIGLSIAMANFDPEQIADSAMAGMNGDRPAVPDTAIAQFGFSIADENFIPRVLAMTAPMTGQDVQTTITMAQSGITMLALMEPSLAGVATELSAAVGNLLRSSGTIGVTIDFDPPFTLSEIEAGDIQGPEDVLSRIDIDVTYEAP